MASRFQRRNKKKLSVENVEAAEKRKTSHPVMWVISIAILVVIVVTFIGAPLAGNTQSGGRLVFGSYDGTDLEYYEGSYFADQVFQINEEYKDTITDQNSQFIMYQIWRSAFENAMFRLAVITEIKNSGVVISSKAVDRAIVNYGPYMENGEFSENLYAQSSNIEKKYTRKKFEDDLYFGQYLNDINTNTINLNEAEFFKDIASTEKKFRYIYLPFSDYPDSELTAYAEENSGLFREISVSKITINSDIKDAEAVLSKLETDPGLFSELAKTQSADPYADKGGEMGTRYYYELKNLIDDNEALDSIFALGEGQISGIIEDVGTWAIYRCDREPVTLDLETETGKDIVRDYMQRYEKGIIEDYLIARAETFTGNARSTDFYSAGSKAGYDIYETNYFPVIYGNPNVTYYQQNIPVYTQPSSADPDNALSGAAMNEFFLKSLNRLAEGEVSDPLILNNFVVVAELTDEMKKDPEELTAVTSLISYAGQMWQGNHLRDIIFESPRLEDNFSEVFARLFLN